ncbi:MAG: hypothetical protein MRZ38_01500 [Muribaculaceae bacterium]|nr:hypothetical protein [Muribaculaceae bacterium]
MIYSKLLQVERNAKPKAQLLSFDIPEAKRDLFKITVLLEANILQETQSVQKKVVTL